MVTTDVSMMKKARFCGMRIDRMEDFRIPMKSLLIHNFVIEHRLCNSVPICNCVHNRNLEHNTFFKGSPDYERGCVLIGADMFSIGHSEWKESEDDLDVFKSLLRSSQGHLELTITWDAGMQWTRLSAHDGIVTEENGKL